jgi:thiol-disulfide isomerase/thioredoxin
MPTRVRAPEFPEGFEWLQTPRPLSLSHLRGQVVILDFWTYCCINCMHVLPVLAALEEKRREDPVVVIGVHSAKFSGEKDARRIREALVRYDVKHPVVVDVDHKIWQSYTVRSWPTLVVVRPDGSIAAVAPGEADLEALDAFVQTVLDDAREDGTLAGEPLRIVESAESRSGPLAFPGKVVSLPGDRLALSDSGHHRLLVLTLDGRVELAVGSGEAGFVDGAAEEARFRSPQGLSFDPDTDVLFVADTGNHAIREVDLGRRRVRTAAGTGSLGRGIPHARVAAREMPLRSPWDVVVAGDFVIVAMAGAHQIWTYSRIEETVGVLAGSGREGLADGTFAEAAFAQPSGLALEGSSLYVADSETSAVRRLDLVHGEVRTLVGTGLFDFGDVDGSRVSALLQHPLGIATGPSGLLVADTYNHKIKRIDPEAGGARTHFERDGEIGLREPAGLCQLGDGRVVVADTNHHRLVVLDAAGRAVPLDVVAAPASSEEAVAGAPARTLRRITLRPGDVTLRLRLQEPAGFDLASGSRVSIRIEALPVFAAPEGDLGFEVAGTRRGVPVLLKDVAGVESVPGGFEGMITVEVAAVLCSHGEAAACWPVGAVYRLPFLRHESSGAAADVALPLPAPPVDGEGPRGAIDSPGTPG